MRQKKWKERIGGNPGLIIIGAFIVLSIIAAADHLFSLPQLLSGTPPEQFEGGELVFDLVVIFYIGLISFILVRKSGAERREIEQIHWRERDKAQEYLDVAGVILLALNAEQKVTLINRKGCEILGYKEEEITGKNWFDQFVPEWDRERVRAAFVKLMPGGHKAADYFENPILTKSGEERIIAWHDTLLTDERGNITGTLSSGEDITERKQAEEQIAYQAQLLAIVNDAVVASDAQYRLTVWNAAAESMYGWKAEEVLGRLGLDITRTEFPDVDKAEMLRAIAECGSWLGEATQAHKDGTRFPVEVSSVVVRDTTGKVTGFVSVNRDITERKKAEEVLREREERFRQLAENIDQVFWLTDWDAKRLLYVNPAYERLYGRSCRSAYDNRMSWQDVIHPEDRARVKKAFAQSADLGQYVEAEYRIVHDDGTVHWVLDRSYPIRDKYGRIYRFASVAEDITGRKKAEEALRENEERLKLVLEGAELGSWDQNMKTGKVVRNRRWAEMLGYTLEEIDSHADAWKELIHPDDLPIVNRIIENHEAGRTPFFRCEHRMRTKSGEWKWVLNCGKIIQRDSDGKPVRATGTHTDITERKQAEEKLRESKERYKALFERSLDCVYIHDFDGNFLDANPASLNLLGFTRDEIKSLNFSSILSEDQIPLALQAIEELIKKGFQEKVTEVRLKHKNGKYVDVEVKASIIYRDGKPYAVQGIARDITERKKAEKSIREALEKRKELEFIINKSPSIVFLWKAAEGWPVEYVSDNISLFGYSAEDFLTGRISYSQIIHPEDLERIGAEVSRYSQEGVSEFTQEYRIITKGGEVKWIDDRTWVRRDSNGVITHYQGIILDITERKKAEELIRTSEAQLSNAMKIAKLGYWEYDVADDLLTLNDRFYSILCTSAEHVGGYRMSSARYIELFLHPDDIHIVIAEMKKALETTDPLLSGQIEHRLIYGDGETGYISMHYSIVKNNQGRTVRVYGVMQDITERKEAEEAIRTERDKLENVTKNIGVGLAIVSKDYQTVWANDVLKQIFGEVEGELCYNTYNGRTDICPGCGVREVFEQGKDMSVHEQVGKDKDGNTIWSQIITTPLRDKEGNITAAMEVVVPITDRKKAEEALRESEEKHRTYIENAPDGIFIVDSEARYIDVNEAACRMTGYSRNELLNMTIMQLAPSDTPPEVLEPFEKLKRHGKTISEIIIQRKDGSVIHASLDAVALSDGRYMAFCSDVTGRKKAEEALKESEERYRNFFENAPLGIYRTTPDGRILLSNPALVQMLGYSSFEELASRNLEKEGFEPHYSRNKFKESLEKTSEVRGLESAWLRRDSSTIFVRENARAVRKEDGSILYYEGMAEDITERKKAEEALRTSEESYRLLFERNLAGVFRTTLDGQILDCNESLVKLFGYDSREELLTHQAWDVYLDKSDRETFISHLLNQKVLVNYEIRFKRKDGSILWGLENVGLLSEKETGTSIIESTIIDITERKKAEEALRESEEKYRALLETTDTGFCILDSQGIIMDANSEYVRLAGHSTLAEIMGRNVIKWTAEHDLEKNAEEVKKCMRQGFVRNLEIEYVDKQGKTTPVEINASMIQTDKGQRILTLCRDITERKKADEALRESEQRYRGVVDNIGIGVSLISPNLEILFLNKQMKKWFPNVDISKEAICYRAFNSPPREEACSYCPTNKTLQDGRVHESITETPAGDKIINYRMVSSPIKDLQGKVIAAIEMVEDITEKKRLQEQLIQTEKLAAVGTLAYGIAHEFNNILAGMMANAELGLISKEHEQIKECFEIIVDNSHRASSITNNLLAFARHKEARKELVDITEPLKSVLAITHRELEKNNIEIIEKFKPVPKIYCDPGQFSEVFLNLITNARDAMHPKGGTLTIQVEPAEEDIRIVFKDNGCGIPEEIKGRIFEPFVTTKGALGRSEVPGTGLGLFLTYGIINGYKGKIEVETKVGKGTKFSIIIPISENQPRELLLDTRIESSKETEKKLKILLVDDEKAIILGLKKFLESKGHKVSTSLRAKEGLEIFRKGRFDLVLSDLTIPDMDGIELIKKVKEKDPQAKIIVITGHIQKEKEEKARQAGADEVLIKPFRNELLYQTISKIVI